MYQYSNSLIRQFPSSVTGNAAVGIQATVYVGETNTLASLFDVGGGAKSNPVTTDDKGFYSFSVADGDYRIVFSSSQFATLRISVLDGAAIREEFDDLVASNTAFRNEQQAAYDSFVAAQGFYPVAGSFEDGGTITERNQVLQRTTAPAAYFSWGGTLPKVVPPGSTVAGTGGEGVTAWTNRNDTTLRRDLEDGTANVGGVISGELDKNYKIDVARRPYNANRHGISDVTAAFAAAKADAASNPTMPYAVNGGGFPIIHLPKGIYKLDATWVIDNTIGMWVNGDGDPATTIVLTDPDTILLQTKGFLNLRFSGIRFMAGTIQPDGSVTALNTTATCWFVESGNTGADVHFEDCGFYYFGNVIDAPNQNNGDNVSFNRCRFMYNFNVFNNENFQLIAWAFRSCKMYYNTGVLFRNPPEAMVVDVLDAINPGVFCRVDLPNFGDSVVFRNVRWESYQNIDPASNPVFLQSTSAAGFSMRFESCKISPVLIIDPAKVVWDLDGYYNLTFEGGDVCSVGGRMKLRTNVDAVNGGNSIVRFINSPPPLVSNLDIEAKAASAGAKTSLVIDHTNQYGGSVIRSFCGLPATFMQSSGKANGSRGNCDLFSVEASIDNNAVGQTFPVYVATGYRLAPVSVEITSGNNTVNSYKVTLWDSAAKSIKIYEKTILGNSVMVTPFDPAALLTTHFVGAGGSLYLEVSGTSLVGLLTATVNVKYAQDIIRG